MSNSKEIVVLRAYRPFLKMICLYQFDNFRNNGRRTVIRNICYALCFAFLFFMQVFFFFVSELFYAYTNRAHLTKFIGPLSFGMLAFHVPMIYTVMCWKRQRIIETIDYMRGIVVESKIRFI